MLHQSLQRLCLAAGFAMIFAGCATHDNGDTMRRDPGSRAKAESRDHERPTRRESAKHDMLGAVPAGMTRSITAFPTGVPEGSGLLVAKTAPQSVQVNAPYEYTIRAINLTDVTLQDVVVEDQMPGTFNIEGAEPRADTDGDTLSWELGELAPGASRTIRVSGAATEPGELTHCATGAYALAACLTTVVNQPALKIVKTGPDRVLQCDPIPYKLTVTNTGTGPATGVVINDTMSKGMTTAQGRDSARIEIGTIEAGKSKTVTVNARANKTGEFTNTATATANGGLEAQAEASTTVVKPVLTLEKTGPEKIFLGKTITYNLTVKNTGDGVAANTVIKDRIPEGTSFVSALGNPRRADGLVTWQFGNLKPGEQRKVRMVLRAEQRGRANTRATANADCASAVADAAVTNIEGIPAILLEVVDENDPVAVGNEEVYTITVTNQGSAAGKNIALTCNIEEGMQFAGGRGDTRVTADGKTIRIAPLKQLAPGAKASWKVRVKATDVGGVRFKVSMTSNWMKRPVEETEATNFYE